MVMTPRIKGLVIASCALIVIGASVFTYYQLRGEVKVEADEKETTKNIKSISTGTPVVGTVKLVQHPISLKLVHASNATAPVDQLGYGKVPDLLSTVTVPRDQPDNGDVSSFTSGNQPDNVDGVPSSEHGPSYSTDTKTFAVSSTCSLKYSFKLKDFNDTIIYSVQTDDYRLSSIVSLNSQTKILKKITDNLFKRPNLTISPDGRFIAFTKHDCDDFGLRGLYLMNLDGSNEKKLVDIIDNVGLINDSSRGFAFSSDSKRILYLDANFKISQIDLNGDVKTIKSVVKIIPEENNILCTGEYLYFLNNDSFLPRKKLFMIWRKNLSDDSDPERVCTIPDYENGKAYRLREFKVYPDGKKLLVKMSKKKGEDTEYMIFVLNIKDTEQGISGEYASLSDVKPLFDPATSKKLSYFLWSEDGKWIYAKKDYSSTDENFENDGLVRFKAESTGETDIELVISNFSPISGFEFVPKNKE